MIDGDRWVRHDGDVTVTRELPLLTSTAEPCCAPLSAGRLDVDQATDLARRLKVLADPTRLRLLSMLLDTEGGACTCDLVEPLGLSQPTVTHHLQRLADVGVVHGERRGRWTYYSVDKDAIDGITAALRL
jgi:ArsR family transcriptional regulator, arsenate/arsenite/antimonite-responsive transcriptional repressor